MAIVAASSQRKELSKWHTALVACVRMFVWLIGSPGNTEGISDMLYSASTTISITLKLLYKVLCNDAI